MISQHDLKKIPVYPSGPEALSDGIWWTACFISSSEKGTSSSLRSCVGSCSASQLMSTCHRGGCLMKSEKYSCITWALSSNLGRSLAAGYNFSFVCIFWANWKWDLRARACDRVHLGDADVRSNVRFSSEFLMQRFGSVLLLYLQTAAEETEESGVSSLKCFLCSFLTWQTSVWTVYYLAVFHQILNGHSSTVYWNKNYVQSIWKTTLVNSTRRIVQLDLLIITSRQKQRCCKR
jgi:hypothetical protein